MSLRVLFVSKAVAPPFRDGATCLVRDLAPALVSARPTILSTRDAPPLSSRVDIDRIYGGRSRYAPALADNMRVAAHLLADRRHDLWHFVFAPNPSSSHVGKLLRAVRRKRVVQTVASRPRDFRGADKLLFGDHVIALSRHTADALVADGAPSSRIHVVPPPVHDLTRDEQAQSRARKRAGIPAEVPLFVYAGDLEFSRGAAWMGKAAHAVVREVPEAVIAFACRAKTPRARDHQVRLAADLAPLGDRVRMLGEVHDLPALLASARAVPFPVDDLYGKVDLPYVVLESALLRVPTIVVRDTPLAEIPEVPTMAAGDVDALAGWCVDMAKDASAQRNVGESLRQVVRERHAPDVVARQVEDVYGT